MKKADLFFLASAFFIGMYFLYPENSFLNGVDSYGMMIISDSITSSHYVKWFLNPFSFFNLYPLSTETTPPMLISALTQISGIPTMYVMWILADLFYLIGLVSLYLVLKKIDVNIYFVYIGLLAYSFSPTMGILTRWCFISRTPFIHMIPLLIYMLLHLKRHRILMLSIFIITIFSFSRISLFLPLVIIPFIIYRLIDSNHGRIVIDQKFRAHLDKVFVVAFIFTIILSLFGISSLYPTDSDYSSSLLFSGSNDIIYTLNMAINYTTGLGILFPISLVGALFGFFMRKKHSLFYSLLLFPFLLIISDRIYAKVLITAVFPIFLVIGLSKLSELKLFLKHPISVHIVVVSLIVAPFVFHMALPALREWRQGGPLPESRYDVSEDVFNSAYYMQYNIPENASFISDDTIETLRITGISGVESWNSIEVEVFIYDVLDRENVSTIQSDDISIEFFTRTKTVNILIRDWYYSGYYYPSRHYWFVMIHEPNSKDAQMLEDRNTHYILLFEDPNFNTLYGNTSSLVEYVDDEYYSIYKDSSHDLLYFNIYQRMDKIEKW